MTSFFDNSTLPDNAVSLIDLCLEKDCGGEGTDVDNSNSVSFGDRLDLSRDNHRISRILSCPEDIPGSSSTVCKNGLRKVSEANTDILDDGDFDGFVWS